MKVNSVKGYQSHFGYNQVQNQQQVPQNQEPKVTVQQLPKPQYTQPLAGLIAPTKPQSPLPYPMSLPPVGGLITPPPVPKHPLPTMPTPIGGLITPPPKTKLPTIPTVTAGLIAHPEDNKIKEHIEKIKEEIAKIEQGQ